MQNVISLETRRPFTAELPARFDVHVASMLGDAVERSRHNHVRIDGSAVAFIDAAGLQTLARLADDIALAGGTFEILEPSSALRITIELTDTTIATSASALVAA